MNKEQLIKRVSDMTGETLTTVEDILNATVAAVKYEVKQGEYVKIMGFGTFVKARYKARAAWNPQTGKAIKIPATWRPKFKAHEAFKETVR